MSFNPVKFSSTLRLLAISCVISLSTVTRADADTYYLQTFNGHYVSAVNGGGVGGPNCGPAMLALHTDAATVGAWETFGVVWLNNQHTKIAFRTASGNFVTAVQGGGIGGRNTNPIRTDAQTPGPWERFTLNFFNDGRSVSIQTPNGRYVSAVDGGGCGGPNTVPIHTDTKLVSAWETFTLSKAGAASVESQSPLEAAGQTHVVATGQVRPAPSSTPVPQAVAQRQKLIAQMRASGIPTSFPRVFSVRPTDWAAFVKKIGLNPDDADLASKLHAYQADRAKAVGNYRRVAIAKLAAASKAANLSVIGAAPLGWKLGSRDLVSPSYRQPPSNHIVPSILEVDGLDSTAANTVNVKGIRFPTDPTVVLDLGTCGVHLLKISDIKGAISSPTEISFPRPRFAVTAEFDNLSPMWSPAWLPAAAKLSIVGTDAATQPFPVKYAPTITDYDFADVPIVPDTPHTWTDYGLITEFQDSDSIFQTPPANRISTSSSDPVVEGEDQILANVGLLNRWSFRWILWQDSFPTANPSWLPPGVLGIQSWLGINPLNEPNWLSDRWLSTYGSDQSDPIWESNGYWGGPGFGHLWVPVYWWYGPGGSVAYDVQYLLRGPWGTRATSKDNTYGNCTDEQ